MIKFAQIGNAVIRMDGLKLIEVQRMRDDVNMVRIVALYENTEPIEIGHYNVDAVTAIIEKFLKQVNTE